MTEQTPICPRCKTTMEGPVITLSRVDNKTRICGNCGRQEEVYNFEHPDRSLPDLNNPIPFAS